MAYATLVSLANTLQYFALEDKFNIFGDADADADADAKRRPFESLLENVVFLRDFLEKFPRKARNLEPRIRDSANEVECLIEYYISDTKSPHGQVSSCKDIDQLVLEIVEIDARIDSIVREAKGMGGSSTTTVEEDGYISNYLPRNSDKVHKKEVIVGLEDDLSKIKDRLFSNDSELVAIPIVGMGGIGKSTLAKVIFDNPAVRKKFDRRRWVTMSYDYDLGATYSAILGENSSCDSTDTVELGVKVYQCLKKVRYFIVIDDIWSSDAWDHLRNVLPDDSNSSRVLLTTRDEKVATYVVSSNYIHRLELMDEKISWILFERMVFGEEHCPPEMVSIAEKIIRGCRGLPLAISIISGILSNVKCTVDAWNNVAEDVNGALNDGDEHFDEILSLSYYRLPTHLKPCFLYFGAFPEDYNIRVADLVRYWAADGFLNASKTTNDVEEIAYEYLRDLIRRNLIMIVSEKDCGKINKCKIHDLLRNVCRRVAGEENFFRHDEGLSLGDVRRASFTSRISNDDLNDAHGFSTRVVLCFQHDDYSLMMNLRGLKLLRVLDARSIALEEFPDQFLRLYHLRFLALSYTNSRKFKIPAEISRLENLETFIVDSVYRLGSYLYMPPEIWDMSNLKHIIVYDFQYLPPPTDESSSGFRNLKTLWNVFNFKWEQHLVESISSVKKMVLMMYLNHELNRAWSDYLLENIQHLGDLETLKMYFDYKTYDSEWCKRNPLLKSLAFPRNLRKLTIVGCAPRVPWEDVNDVIGSLPNLEVLRLIHFSSSGRWETNDGCFSNLRVLEVSDSNIQRLIIESSSHFPSLELLYLRYCKALIELPSCIGDILTLRRIVLEGNNPAVYVWASQIEEEQRDMGNDELTIVREDSSFQDGFREVIGETSERLSIDELVEKLMSWAGDDEIKHREATLAGISYIQTYCEVWEETQSQMYAFVNAMKSFNKVEESENRDIFNT